MKAESFLSPEVTRLLRDAFADGLDPFEPAQPRRTIMLSPEVYERLKNYAERHNQSMSEVANFKLEVVPTAEGEAEINALIASQQSPEAGIRRSLHCADVRESRLKVKTAISPRAVQPSGGC